MSEGLAEAQAVLATYDRDCCYGCGATVAINEETGIRQMRHLADDCVVLKALTYIAARQP
jgi:hypothetical protein